MIFPYGNDHPEAEQWADEDGTVHGVEHDGAVLLDAVHCFAERFLALPSPAALDAFVLWCAHTHVLDCFESTPRLALLSPEPESGKTRALEIADLLVPHPMHAVNCTPAALFRAINDLEHRPTILYDEIDTVFGPKAKENEEVRGLLNAGHRRGAVAYRCVGEGTKQTVVPFPAYSALALAGIGDLPDTIMGRSVVIRMRRRAAHEQVESFRHRMHRGNGEDLRERLAAWTRQYEQKLPEYYPMLPEGISDRPADVWEPLLAIAECAGGDWPDRARAACTELVSAARGSDSGSLGMRLLADIEQAFRPRGEDGTPIVEHDRYSTEGLLEALHNIEDAPWSDLRGRELDSRGLARRLKPYGVTSRKIHLGEGQTKKKGYLREDFYDAWSRYLPGASPDERGTWGTRGTSQVNGGASSSPLVPPSTRGELEGNYLQACAQESSSSSPSSPTLPGEAGTAT